MKFIRGFVCNSIKKLLLPLKKLKVQAWFFSVQNGENHSLSFCFHHNTNPVSIIVVHHRVALIDRLKYLLSHMWLYGTVGKSAASVSQSTRVWIPLKAETEGFSIVKRTQEGVAVGPFPWACSLCSIDCFWLICCEQTQQGLLSVDENCFGDTYPKKRFLKNAFKLYTVYFNDELVFFRAYSDAPSCLTSKLNMWPEFSNKRATLNDVAEITAQVTQAHNAYIYKT